MKKLLFAGLIVLIATLSFLSLQKSETVTISDRPTIAASFYPLAFISEQIAGTDASVISITPAGIEPHDYEPTAQEIASVLNAHLFVFNGSGLDPWAHRLEADLEKRNISFIEATEMIDLIAGEEHEHDTPTLDDGVDDHDDHGEGLDPHIWLDPAILNQIAGHIADEMKAIDPAHAEGYATRYNTLSERLMALDKSYHAGLTNCTSRDFITSHAAFGYLAKAYNLHQMPIAGLSPEAEPSAQELATIADFAKKNKVAYIFFESLVSPKLANTIASEVGAKTLVLNPIEGLSQDDLAAGKTYFSEMEQNLANLRTALSCK